VSFKAQPVVEAITLQSLELPNPIHDAATDRSPIVFVIWLAHYIFAVAVPDAVFGQQLISGNDRRSVFRHDLRKATNPGTPAAGSLSEV